MKKRTSLRRIVLFALLLAGPEVVHALGNPLVLYYYNIFNVRNDFMVEVEFGDLMGLRDLSDIENLEKPKDGLLLEKCNNALFPFFYKDYLLFCGEITEGTGEFGFEVLNISGAPDSYLENPSVGYYVASDSEYLIDSFWDLDRLNILEIQDSYCFLKVWENSSSNSIRLVDLSNLSLPIETSSISYNPSIIGDFGLYNNTMFLLLLEAENNLRLVNITNKSEPFDYSVDYSVPIGNNYKLDIIENQLFVFGDNKIYQYTVSNSTYIQSTKNYTIFDNPNDDIIQLCFVDNYFFAMSSGIVHIFDYVSPSIEPVSTISFGFTESSNFYHCIIDNSRIYLARRTQYEDQTLLVYNISTINKIERIYPSVITFPTSQISISIAVTITSLSFVSITLRLATKKRKKLFSQTAL